MHEVTPVPPVIPVTTVASGSGQAALSAERARSRPAVAIVGMDCCFAGEATSPEALWRMLAEGRHAASDLPRDRGWRLEALYHPDPEAAGRTYVRRGGFLTDVAGFDADCFSIGPREAAAMDPQQRLLLESSWHALERARMAPARLAGSDTGVYVGLNESGYRHLAAPAALGLESYLLTGTAMSVASGRIAYAFGLNGPALTVDTACSASLVALHLAVRALRGGECEMAIVASSSVIAAPDALVGFSRMGALAADGRSKSFAAEADGFAPAEGVAAVVLMTLERARALGQPVLAVVRGSAINEDGASTHLTSPSGPAQRKVIAAALRDAGLDASQIKVVEAHGPGTRVGDPIEAASLQACYARHRTRDDPLWIGSVKSNIGHTQAVAGLAGVVKTVLALQHELLPATLHAHRLNPEIDWSEGTMRLVRRPRPWPRGAEPRRAGVLAYGISGTNAHVLLEEAPADLQAEEQRGVCGPAPSSGGGPSVWTLSAVTEPALREQAVRLARQLRAAEAFDVADVGWSLGTTRGALARRAAVIGRDMDALLAGLDALARGDAPAQGTDAATALVRGTALSGAGPVFVLPGQGAQWPGMGRRLSAASPVFCAAMERCARALQPWTNFDVRDVVGGDVGASDWARAEVVQPALFAMYVSLAQLWRAYGLRPAALIGHSQGEIAAAHLAGVLSLEEAAKVVALRSRALRHVSAAGAMASLAAPADCVRDLLVRWRGRLEVAAVNGPAATVVSGDAGALTELLDYCRQHGFSNRLLPVDYASHSAHIEAAREQVLADLAGLAPRPGKIPIFSTTLGEAIDTTRMTAEYWYRNLRETVLFETAVRRSLAAGHRHFVEVSPHPILASALSDLLADTGTEGAVTATLHHNDGGLPDFTVSLAHAHVHGAPVDWRALYPRGRGVDLPVYPFQRRHHWLPHAPSTVDLSAAGQEAVPHPMLAAAADLPDGGMMLTGRLSLTDQPWLADHAVRHAALLPATAMLELFLQAADRCGYAALDDVTFQAPAVLLPGNALDVQVHCGAEGDARLRTLALYTRPREGSGTWSCHATAIASPTGGDGADTAAPDVTPWPPPTARAVPVSECYDTLRAEGYAYGPAFRNLRALWRDERTAYCEVALGEEAHSQAASYTMHPALLDAALHPLVLTQENGSRRILLPYAVGSVRVLVQGAVAARARLVPTGPHCFRVHLIDSSDQPVAVLEDLQLRPITSRALRRAFHRTEPSTFHLVWRPVPLPADRAGVSPSRWAIIGSGPHLADAVLYRDAPSLATALDDGTAVPEGVILDCRGTPVSVPGSVGDRAVAAHGLLSWLLIQVQACLADERLQATQLVVLTEGAQSVRFAEPVLDAAGAACSGLIRSAQNEHPGRLRLVDLQHDTVPQDALWAAVAGPHRELALRGSQAYVPRLAHTEDADLLPLPDDGTPWRLSAGVNGTIDSVAAAPAPRLNEPLGPEQVRVRVHASALNFRDSMVALAMLDGSTLGVEAAGTVLEVGELVRDVAVGERVAALCGPGSQPGTFGSHIVADHRTVTAVPAHWTDQQAASVLVAFVSAHLALIDVAHIRARDKVLIHAAAGGVGQAAVQLAALRGAEIYATASVPKHPTVRALGVPQGRIADSRSLDFEEQLRRATGGTGFDIVIGSLAGEFVDASLRLLRPGGRYVEMGKTDIRTAEDVALHHPRAAYYVIDALALSTARLGEVVRTLGTLFHDGTLSHSDHCSSSSYWWRSVRPCRGCGL
ncbi:beta-ketoacyl synthase N-terminal-like domain-containing protein, partial [Streptomyces spectabilis]|uniref:beta-ketoacyl synthase N-terminal-like domain-containing protein n=1 Tax=Streptomyces spectabilis TaxID=68270 RepID=UPI0033C79D8F